MAKSPEEKNTSFPSAFTIRLARILHSFMEGVMELLESEDALLPKLKNLSGVIQKSIRVKPLDGLALDVAAYFEHVKMAKEIAKAEKDDIKSIFIELANSLKGVAGVSGNFSENIGGYINKIETASTLSDIIECKNVIVENMDEMRVECQKMKSELELLQNEVGGLSKRLHESESKVHVDTLTNVYNRSAYEIKISQAIRNFRQFKFSTALFVIDIDFFKRINDEFGHKAGDEVLRSISDTLKSNIRESDFLFRYGGEEFVIIMQKVERANAIKLAEKLRTSVEKDYLVYKEKKLAVTISIGVSFLKEGDEESNLFENADKALYRAKTTGRNRVVIAE
jgi:diguanylate cyclase